MNDITEPFRLAVGPHRPGSGRGCVQNVVSWANGDTVITDLPECADPFLNVINQFLNDRICSHRDGDLLCVACTQLVLPFGWASMGTAGVATPEMYVRLAVAAARDVAHLNPDPRVETAITAAETWLTDPTRKAADAARARAAADAARAAADAAADAAYAADTYAYAAYAADTYAYAAYAAYAAADAADTYAAAADAARAAGEAAEAAEAAYAAGGSATSVVEWAETQHQRWQELTDHTPPPVDTATQTIAINQMLKVTS